jgi:hypothetical protein
VHSAKATVYGKKLQSVANSLFERMEQIQEQKVQEMIGQRSNRDQQRETIRNQRVHINHNFMVSFTVFVINKLLSQTIYALF